MRFLRALWHGMLCGAVLTGCGVASAQAFERQMVQVRTPGNATHRTVNPSSEALGPVVITNGGGMILSWSVDSVAPYWVLLEVRDCRNQNQFIRIAESYYGGGNSNPAAPSGIVNCHVRAGWSLLCPSQKSQVLDLRPWIAGKQQVEMLMRFCPVSPSGGAASCEETKVWLHPGRTRG